MRYEARHRNGVWITFDTEAYEAVCAHGRKVDAMGKADAMNNKDRR
jgi:hypothetical protein